MSAQARCVHAYGIDARAVIGHNAKAHLSLPQESKRCLGSTDLLICIGEMCATASTSEGEHGHGRGQNERYDRNGTAS